jgi:phosphomannomutase
VLVTAFIEIMVDNIFPPVSSAICDKKEFLYDVKCSKVMEDMINAWGGKAILYRTGASYTEFKTHEENLPFGGEYSGHLYFRDRDADCASAIYASLRLLEITWTWVIRIFERL